MFFREAKQSLFPLSPSPSSYQLPATSPDLTAISYRLSAIGYTLPAILENVLDQASREKLLPLFSEEERGLDTLAQVKFFTPDIYRTWHASSLDVQGDGVAIPL